MLGCCGYALGYCCAGVLGLRTAKVLPSIWITGELVVLLVMEWSRSEVAETGEFGLEKSDAVFIPSRFHLTESPNRRAETCQRDLLTFNVTTRLNIQCACLQIILEDLSSQRSIHASTALRPVENTRYGCADHFSAWL